MKNSETKFFPGFKYNSADKENFFIIAGPCVIESYDICLKIASILTELSNKFKVDIIFKASYDKANRTSKKSFRGVGREQGLFILDAVKKETGLLTLTDIHECDQVAEASQVVDILQIPAFLCRQTDLLQAAAESGKIVNVKKGQFMAPSDMKYSIDKAGPNSWVTERGTFFGYNRLVVDFTGIPVMKQFGHPVIFDATHSVQEPGGGSGFSSGNREAALPLAKAAIMMGVDGLFFEIHPDPDNALCDGPNSLSTEQFAKAVPHLLELHALSKKNF